MGIGSSKMRVDTEPQDNQEVYFLLNTDGCVYNVISIKQ